MSKQKKREEEKEGKTFKLEKDVKKFEEGIMTHESIIKKKNDESLEKETRTKQLENEVKSYENEQIVKRDAIDSNDAELEDKENKIEELTLAIADLKSEFESTKEHERENAVEAADRDVNAGFHSEKHAAGILCLIDCALKCHRFGIEEVDEAMLRKEKLMCVNDYEEASLDPRREGSMLTTHDTSSEIVSFEETWKKITSNIDVNKIERRLIKKHHLRMVKNR